MKKNKRIITESERQADLIKRQQAIKESFGKGMELLGESSPWDDVDDVGSAAFNDRAYDPDPEGEPKFKVGMIITNTGNDGEFFTLDGKQTLVQYPYEFKAKIIDIKDGFYIVKDENNETWKVSRNDPYYEEVVTTAHFPERDGPMYEGNGDYPAGAEHDPRAPYNQVEAEFIGVEPIQFKRTNDLDEINFKLHFKMGENSGIAISPSLLIMVEAGYINAESAFAYGEDPNNVELIVDGVEDYVLENISEVEDRVDWNEYDGGYDDNYRDDMNEVDPVGDEIRDDSGFKLVIRRVGLHMLIELTYTYKRNNEPSMDINGNPYYNTVDDTIFKMKTNKIDLVRKVFNIDDDSFVHINDRDVIEYGLYNLNKKYDNEFFEDIEHDVQSEIDMMNGEPDGGDF